MTINSAITYLAKTCFCKVTNVSRNNYTLSFDFKDSDLENKELTEWTKDDIIAYAEYNQKEDGSETFKIPSDRILGSTYCTDCKRYGEDCKCEEKE